MHLCAFAFSLGERAARKNAPPRCAEKKLHASKKPLTVKLSSFTVVSQKGGNSAMAKKKKATTKKSSKKTTKKKK